MEQPAQGERGWGNLLHSGQCLQRPDTGDVVRHRTHPAQALNQAWHGLDIAADEQGIDPR
jgi:hypothetical protein